MENTLFTINKNDVLQEKTKKKNFADTKYFNVNWNKIFVKQLNDLIEINIKDYTNHFRKWIDQIVFLIWVSWWKYKYLILEKDWSFSEMCWNGAVACFKYLENSNQISDNSLSLVTINNNKVTITKINWNYIINMWEVPCWNDAIEQMKKYGYISKNIDNFENIKESFSFDRILQEIYNYKNNPDSIKEILWNNQDISIYQTYFMYLIQNLENNDTFFNFCKNLELKEISLAGWEPHFIINMISSWSEFLDNYFLKLISFVFRYMWINWNKIFPKWMNFNFYLNNNWTYINLPSERWVFNWINYDQTWSCWTGTLCVWTFLLHQNNIKQISIQTRAWYIVSVNWWENTTLIINESNLENKEITSQPNFISQVIYENLKFKLLTIFWKEWENINNCIKTIIKGTWINAIQSIHERFSQDLFSSCFHETEFPIDPYKIISTVIWNNLMEQLWLRHLELNYLDITNWDLNWFPNIKIWKKWEKKLLKIIKELFVSNEKLSDKRKKSKEIFLNLIWLQDITELQEWYNSSIINSLSNSPIWEYIINLFQEIFWQELFDFLNSKWIGKQWKQKKFLISLLHQNILKIINWIYHNFEKLLILRFIRLKNQFSVDMDDDTLYRTILAEYQNSILTYFLNNTLDWEIFDTFNKLWYTRNNMLNISLSSHNNKLKAKLTCSLSEILHDKNLWYNFFKIFCKNAIIAKWWSKISLWTIKYKNKKMNIFVWIVENDIKFYCWNDAKSINEKSIIETKEAINILLNIHEEVELLNYQWILAFLVILIGWGFTIWSERWFRDIVTNSLQEHFGTWINENMQKFIKLIDSQKLTADYVPSQTLYTQYPAWTDNILPWDIFKLIFINGRYSKEEIERFLINPIIQLEQSTNNKLEIWKSISENFELHDFNSIHAQWLIDNSDIIVDPNHELFETKSRLKEEKEKALSDNWKDLYSTIYSCLIKYLMINRLHEKKK